MGAADLQCNPALASDTELLLGLARAFHAEDGHPLSPEGEAALSGITLGEPMARCWIVRRAGQAIGYVIVTLGYSIEHGGRDGFIDDLYLVPSARGGGTGAAVLDFALEQARRTGIATLHLEVDPKNDRATALYRSHGFAENGRCLMSLRLRAHG
ncbi:MAG TPA: GNAT family N-acetyltransferase [Stellaceae bacterium]|nr:GNAT family N-acetyltransferase [Stellaceae bacterium]